MQKRSSIFTKQLKDMTSRQCITAMVFYLILFVLSVFCSLILGGLGSILSPIIALLIPMICLGMIILLCLQIRRNSHQTVTKKQPVQQPDRMQEVPEEMAPVYQQRIDILHDHLTSIAKREKAVEDLLDDTFAGSQISKDRYLQVIHNAQKVLRQNYEKARQAAILFGSFQITDTRIEIMDRYVSDSSDVVSSMEKVFDELIRLEQNSVIRSGDSLDQALEELAASTACYEKNLQ